MLLKPILKIKIWSVQSTD